MGSPHFPGLLFGEKARFATGKFAVRQLQLNPFCYTPLAIADLQHWQNDTFQAHWHDRTIEDAFLTFTLKPDGAIDHFTMVPVSPAADFSFDYQDLYLTPAP